MRFDAADIRVHRAYGSGPWPIAWLLAIFGIWGAAQQIPGGQKQSGVLAVSSPLTTHQVVERLTGMNLRRAQALHSYHGTRSYRVEYRSSLKTVSAEMVVEVKYLAPGTKDFTIQSSTGSKLIVDKVFRKILQAEEDALSIEAQRRTALNYDNYDITMVGYESTPTRSMYVLAVEPRTKNRFLFRGRVWVDADDFAVVRIKGEPAKNPSFWTKHNEIEQSYIKVSDFWLPEWNHSIASIRLGGRAELTIEYNNYQITAADPVSKIARSSGTDRARDCSETSPRDSTGASSCTSAVSSDRNQRPFPDHPPCFRSP